MDATKKFGKDDFTSAPREGAYLYGLYMTGARWDTQTGMIQEAKLKELCPQMPILFCRVRDGAAVPGVWMTYTFAIAHFGTNTSFNKWLPPVSNCS